MFGVSSGTDKINPCVDPKKLQFLPINSYDAMFKPPKKNRNEIIVGRTTPIISWYIDAFGYFLSLAKQIQSGNRSITG